MTDRNETALRGDHASTEWRPAEGVRLIDAEEAQRVVEAGRATARRSDDGPGGGARPAVDGRRRRADGEGRPPTDAPLGAPSAIASRALADRPGGPSPDASRPAASPPAPPPAQLHWSTADAAPGSGQEAIPPDEVAAGTRRGATRAAVRVSDVPSWGPPPTGGVAMDDHADTDTDAFAYTAPEPDDGAPAGRDASAPDTLITVTGGPTLPHWTEPADDEAQRPGRPQRDGRGSVGSGARWRNDYEDWDDLDAGSDLFGDDDPEPSLGALETDRSARYSFDEAFQQLQQERSGSHRAGLPEDPDEVATARSGGPGRVGRDMARRRLRPQTTSPQAGSTAFGGRFRRRGDGPGPGAPAGLVRGADEAEATEVSLDAGPDDAAGLRTGSSRLPRSAASRGPTDPTPLRRLAGATLLRRQRAGDGDGDGRRGGEDHADVPSPGRGSSLRSRILVGAALAVLLVVAYGIGPEALVVLAAVVVLLCAAEAYSMLQRCGFRPATLLGLAATGGLMFAAYWRGEPALPLVTVLAFAAIMVWYLLGITDARPLANVAVSSMTVVWVGLLGSFAALMLRTPHGKGLFLGAVLVTVAADIVAYFGGRRWGKRALAPKVSPGKTVEGLLAGAVGAVVVGLIVGEWVRPWGGLSHGLLLGVAVAVFAPVGDLFESLIKRDLDIKDSGTVLAGHGGLLDRFDSVLLVLPAAYYLADYLHILK